MAEKSAITELPSIGGLINEGGKFLRHIVFSEILGSSRGEESSDPQYKKDQRNELTLSMFRKLFNLNQPREHADVLDEVFRRLKESDYLIFSLTVLEAVTQSAFSEFKEGEDNEALITTAVTTVSVPAKQKKDAKDKEDKGSKQSDKAKLQTKWEPNLLYESNYNSIIAHINTIIWQVKPKSGTENEQEVWVEKVLRRFSESRIIAHTLTAKLARYADSELILQNWQKIAQRAKEIRNSQIKPISHEFGLNMASLRTAAETNLSAGNARRQTRRQARRERRN